MLWAGAVIHRYVIETNSPRIPAVADGILLVVILLVVDRKWGRRKRGKRKRGKEVQRRQTDTN